MHNELTKMDIQKMREELDYRRVTLRPQLLEEVKVARSFGDLSENFEYKAAKREKNKNESRIRYLENMIKTARVIEDRSAPDTVGLYDKVTIYLEEDGEEESWQVVTTVRQDVLNGLISKESPMGAALLGKKVGERFYVQVNQDYGYYAVVRAIPVSYTHLLFGVLSCRKKDTVGVHGGPPLVPQDGLQTGDLLHLAGKVPV